MFFCKFIYLHTLHTNYIKSSHYFRFKAGKEKWLVTTNVCSRGIDVEQVTLVINFDLPVTFDTHTADCETYLHRIGRLLIILLRIP